MTSFAYFSKNHAADMVDASPYFTTATPNHAAATAPQPKTRQSEAKVSESDETTVSASVSGIENLASTWPRVWDWNLDRLVEQPVRDKNNTSGKAVEVFEEQHEHEMLDTMEDEYDVPEATMCQKNWEDDFLDGTQFNAGGEAKSVGHQNVKAAAEQARECMKRKPAGLPSQEPTGTASTPWGTWSCQKLLTQLSRLAIESLESRSKVSKKAAEDLPSTQWLGSGNSSFSGTWSWLDGGPTQFDPPATQRRNGDLGRRDKTAFDERYHAVREGRDPGIYECPYMLAKQIEGVPNKYKSFLDKQEAIHFLDHESKDCQWRGFCCPQSPQDDDIQWSDEQKKVIEAVINGQNVCYLGPGGTGKSSVLREFVKALREAGQKVWVLAPTGLAALQVHGVTLDSYAGWTPETRKKSMERVMTEAVEGLSGVRIRQTDVLVIDEISMVSSITFDRLNAVCQGATGKHNEAFGGMQV